MEKPALVNVMISAGEEVVEEATKTRWNILSKWTDDFTTFPLSNSALRENFEQKIPSLITATDTVKHAA